MEEAKLKQLRAEAVNAAYAYQTKKQGNEAIMERIAELNGLRAAYMAELDKLYSHMGVTVAQLDDAAYSGTKKKIEDLNLRIEDIREKLTILKRAELTDEADLLREAEEKMRAYEAAEAEAKN